MRLLQDIANGHTAVECAKSCDRSYMAIKRQLMLIEARVGARNMTHAIAIALRKGWIR